MADDEEERKNKWRKIKDDGRKLLVAEEVEVSYLDEGFIGSWHLAVVVEYGHCFRVIKHANLLNEEQSAKLIEVIPVSASIEGTSRATTKNYRGLIRPSPPCSSIQKSELRYGLCVDALIDDVWWEGVICDHEEGSEKRKVFFPDLGDQDVMAVDRLRLTQDWDEVSGEWKPRSEWLLLQVLQDFEEQDGLPVSIREIWYDLRSMRAFKNEVKDWRFGTHDVWLSLVSELIRELWSVINVFPDSELVPLKKLVNVPTPSYGIELQVKDAERLSETTGVHESISRPVLEDGAAKVSESLVQTKVLLPSCGPHERYKESVDCSKASSDFILAQREENSDKIMHCTGVTYGKISDGQGAELDFIRTENKIEHIPVSKVRRSWTPLKLDPEHCPDVIAVCASILKDGKSNPKNSKFSHLSQKELSAIVKKHILSTGWEIDFRNDDRPRFRYRSPDGKLFYSLCNVCHALMEGHQKTAQIYEDDTGSQGDYSGQDTNQFCPVETHQEPLSLSAGNSASPLNRREHHNRNFSPFVAQEVKMEGNLHAKRSMPVAEKLDSTGPHDSGKIVVCHPNSSKSHVGTNIVASQPKNVELRQCVDIAPEYLPEAVQEYEDYIKSLRQPNKQGFPNSKVKLLRSNAKKHLLYMQWRFWHKTKKRNHELCYSSPSGRTYHSLTTACKAYLKEHSKISNLSTLEWRNISDTSTSTSNTLAGASSKQNGCSNFSSLPDVATTRTPDTARLLFEAAENKSRFSKKLSDSSDHGFCKSRPRSLRNSSKKTTGASTVHVGDPQKENDWFSRLPEATTRTQDADLLLSEETEKNSRFSLKLSDSDNLRFSKSRPRSFRNPSKRQMKNHNKLLSYSSSRNSNRKHSKRRKACQSANAQFFRLSRRFSPRVLRSSTRSRELVLTSHSQHSAKTILSWLIDRNVLLPRQKVYDIGEKDGQRKKKGQISRDGIKCFCCNKVFTIANFDAHAGNNSRYPSANIFLNDGKSLLECLVEMMNASKVIDFQHRRLKGDYHQLQNDIICSICHDGGDIILCDYCPSSFHANCLGLKDLPEGNWFCPSCRCGICNLSEYNYDKEQFTAKTMLYCDQCEQEYHVGCLRESRLQRLSNYPTGDWFCSKKCSKIFHCLRKLTGKSNPTSVEGLSWAILRWNTRDNIGLDKFDLNTKAEHHCKLCIALDVLHECFITMIEPRTQSDLAADLLFNRESELNRLNFWGFYTMLLDKEDELISVATFRVYDEKVAEMPFIGTRVEYRRQGMCRLLLSELEKLLCSLGIERLLLPAVPQLLETWTTSFGFTKMESSDRLELSKYTVLGFQDTTMCQKFLSTGKALSTKHRGYNNHLADKSSKSNVQDDSNNHSDVVRVTEPIFIKPIRSIKPSFLEAGNSIEDVSDQSDTSRFRPFSSSTDLVTETIQDEIIESPAMSASTGNCRSSTMERMSPQTVDMNTVIDFCDKFFGKCYKRAPKTVQLS